MGSIGRLALSALLLVTAAVAAGASTVTTPAPPALRGTVGRTLPHANVVMTPANETAIAATTNATSAVITNDEEPLRTGALQWAGQPAAAAAPPSNDQSISASAPMGNQGQSLTDQDTGILPFGGGILNEPSFDDADPDDMTAADMDNPTPAPTSQQSRPAEL